MNTPVISSSADTVYRIKPARVRRSMAVSCGGAAAGGPRHGPVSNISSTRVIDSVLATMVSLSPSRRV